VLHEDEWNFFLSVRERGESIEETIGLFIAEGGGGSAREGGVARLAFN